MRVKLDRKKYANRYHSKAKFYGGIDCNSQKTYDVIAIVKDKKRYCYLLQYDPIGGYLELIDSEFFTVIDEHIPEHWIFRVHNRKDKKARKKIFNLDIIFDLYLGPQELIERVGFFYDVLEYNLEAVQTYYDYLKKYGKEWRTPPQT